MSTKGDLNEVMSVVPDGDRAKFLPKMFGSIFPHVERFVYVFADKQLHGYSSSCGYWEFGLTGGGRPFIYPVMKNEIILVKHPFNDFAVKLPVALAGLVMSLQALCLCLEKYGPDIKSTEERDRLIDLYHNLISDGYSIAGALNCTKQYFELVD
ncbi:MAG: hypothetical protein V3T17_11195 [Pseudomonadales bacterium]